MNKNYNIHHKNRDLIDVIEGLTRQEAVKLIIRLESKGVCIELYNTDTGCMEYKSPT